MDPAFLTLTPRAKLSPCRCAVTASLKRTRNVILVRVTIQHAVIRRRASSRPGPCVTRAARLVVQVIASLRRERNYAGSPGMIGVIRPSFVPVTRRHAQRISPSQTVRTFSPYIPIFLTTLQGQSCGTGGLSCANGICTSLDRMYPSRCRNLLYRNADCLQSNASRQVPRSG